MRNAQQLKGKIKELTREVGQHDGSTAQLLLTTYYNGRMLEEIANSPYRDNFILKGGYLLENMTSVSQRTTADIDFTVQGISDDEEKLREVMERVFAKPTEDGISFDTFHFTKIRQDATYPGVRVAGRANFDGTWAKVKFDITTGDAIYGGPIDFKHKDIVDGHEINIRAYSAEQILAEKLQAIYEKGVSSTRVKDLYDVALLTSDKAIDSVDYAKVNAAFKAVSIRKGTSTDSHTVANTFREVSESAAIKSQWTRFASNEGKNYVGSLDLGHALYAVQKAYHTAGIVDSNDNLALQKERQSFYGRQIL